MFGQLKLDAYPTKGTESFLSVLRGLVGFFFETYQT